LLKIIIGFLFFIVYLLKPSIGLAFDTSDPSVSLLQNRSLIISPGSIAPLFKMVFLKMKQ